MQSLHFAENSYLRQIKVLSEANQKALMYYLNCTSYGGELGMEEFDFQVILFQQ